jgi:aminoglycoside phosphotransferase (APT) family kinase protein
VTDTDFSGTSEVRAGHQFDEKRLDEWLRAHVEGYRGPLTVRQFKGGQSNPTYQLLTPDMGYVLRRKPTGELVKGAHAVEREARVMHALADIAFPVPRIYAMCTDDSVIGSWFYVMEFVSGRSFWDATLPEVSGAHRPAYFDAMNATIAALHAVDHRIVGLEGFGRVENYLGRQIDRWSKQYLGDAQAGRDPNLDRMVAWLPEHVPADEACGIVHGDFRFDNLIFHPTEPRVIAVLDWELSTLGHPLADFAYHVMMYRMPPAVGLPGLDGVDLRRANIPSEIEYVSAYCARVGRTTIPDLDFYLAFNFFRFAAIVHGIKGRIARGSAASAHADKLVRWLPLFAELAWRQAEKCR